jgi:hypothetical protein
MSGHLASRREKFCPSAIQSASRKEMNHQSGKEFPTFSNMIMPPLGASESALKKNMNVIQYIDTNREKISQAGTASAEAHRQHSRGMPDTVPVPTDTIPQEDGNKQGRR